MKRDPVVVVDDNADRESRDLAEHGIDLGGRDGASHTVETCEQRGRRGCYSGQIRIDTEVRRDPLEYGLARYGRIVERVNRKAHVLSFNSSPTICGPSRIHDEARGAVRRFPAREATTDMTCHTIHVMSSPASEPSELGTVLRHWRSVRGTSQLDLASEAGTTPRYVSFVETGRARPSRKMVLRLARALEVPLRERNELLLAAGFAPLYPVEPISSPTMAMVERAFAAMLAVHEPFPAVLIDRRWNVQRANDGAVRLFTWLLAPEPMPAVPNVLRLVLEPGPIRNNLRNWNHVAPALLERVRREAVG